MQATDGNFYGTTGAGGTDGSGTVFSLAVGLGPFVETVPTSGKVGAPVIILGTNLTGATSVTFNGTAATFKIVSASEITTTVPAGATTGPVQVTTPSGTLTSNVNFRVITPVRIAAASNLDGRLEVFARGTDNAVWHTSQAVAGGSTWNQWTSLGGVVTSDPIGGTECGRPAGGLRSGSRFRALAQVANGGLGQHLDSLELCGRQADQRYAVGRNTDGQLEVFARGTDNAIWHTPQTAAGGPNWNGWSSLGGKCSPI